MTQVVTVRTDFADLNQMAQGLIGRVNETHVILPAGTPVDVGEWAQFAVTLLDGTPGLAGMGRCVTYVDNGEDRQAHQRFDVVFDSLQFDPRGQQIYTHILTLSGYDEGADGQHADADAADAADAGDDDGEDRATVDDVHDHELAANGADDAADALSYSDAPGAVTNGVGHAEAFGDSSSAEQYEDDAAEATVIAQRSDMQAAIAATMQTQAPSAVHHVTGGVDDDDEPDFPSEATPVASRAAISAAQAPYEAPVPYAAEPVDASSFHYAGGLPFPALPPRPPLSTSQKVAPAPRPGRA